MYFLKGKSSIFIFPVFIIFMLWNLIFLLLNLNSHTNLLHDFQINVMRCAEMDPQVIVKCF